LIDALRAIDSGTTIPAANPGSHRRDPGFLWEPWRPLLIRFGRFCLDPSQGLTRGSHAVHLTPKALAILSLLAQRAGLVVSKRELFEQVWPDTAVSDAALTSCIQELRHALGDDPRQPRFLETVHRRGFRFVARTVIGEEAALDRAAIEIARSDQLLVGRDVVLEEMGAALQAAIAGNRQVVFVSGDPGIGKSAVIDTFLAGLASRSTVLVAGAACVEHFGVVEAYRPLLETLTRLCKQPNGIRIVATLAQFAPTWLAQLPAVQSPAQFAVLQRRTAGTTRERMLRELTDAVEAMTVDMPAVLWLEDLHWADPSTIDWIAAFARRRESARVLLIGSFRRSEGSGSDVVREVVDALQVKTLCREIALTGLHPSAFATYVVSRYPPAADALASLDGLAAQVRAHTDGNPLFAGHVLADLVTSGALVKEDDGWAPRGDLDQLTLGVPDNVRRVIERQFDRLNADALEILEAAAIVGLEGSAAAVAAGADRGIGEVEAALVSMARQTHFIADAGTEAWPDGTVAARFRFRHSLYRDVLDSRLSVTQRATLHLRVGLRLEAGYGDSASEVSARLAVHFEEGRDVRRAVLHLQQAARTAVRRSALQEAGRSFGRALSLLVTLPDSKERQELEVALRIGMGGVLMAARGFGAVEVEPMYLRARELCRELGDTPQLFPALWGLWLFDWGRGSPGMAHSLAEDLLALARKQEDPAVMLQAYHAMWATSFSIGELQAAHDYAAAGSALYVQDSHFSQVTSYGNHDAAVCARMFAARALALLGHADTAVRTAEEGVALARRLGHPFSLALALVLGAGVHQFLRDAAAAARYASEANVLCSDQGFPLLLAWNTSVAGWAELEHGSPRGAAMIDEGIDRTRRTGSDQFLTHMLGLAADAHLRAGCVERGLSVVEEALALADRTGERFYEGELHRLSGELQLRRRPQQSEDAAAAFARAMHITRRQGARLLTLRASVSLARLRHSQHRFDEVRSVLEEAVAEVAADAKLRDLREASQLWG
jgi:DNA-binding winged helix-turn-helix (wHTH) protein/predicted ATPase